MERVVEARRPLVERIGSARSAVDGLAESLSALETLRAESLGRLDGEEAEALRARLVAVDLVGARVSLADAQRALGRLESRFRRSRLSIGVVGRARQGKSRLLQTLTGLGTTEIPDGDRTHCTGVRSTVLHRPGVEPHAEVWLHSEASFLGHVVAPYHEELQQLGAPPRSLDEWRSRGRPHIEGRVVGTTAARLGHLQKAWDAFESIRPLLGSPSPRRVPLEEVRRWVAQTSVDGQTQYLEHLAVERVEISCTFPHDDLSRLQVVDMPGLGDTGVGDEARLIHTLGHEVDAVLFVRMPKTLGDHWADVDVGLYDLARAALPELPLERWSSFVLNRTRQGAKQGDNLPNCQDLAQDARRQGLRAIDHVIADCSDRDEVVSKVLDPLLDYLSENVASLDRSYASACGAQLEETLGAVRTTLSAARGAMVRTDGGDRENPLYRQLFDATWEDLTGALEAYLSRLQNRRGEEDPDLAAQIQLALDYSRAHPGIPELETIERRRHARGSYAIAYNELMHEVRTELSRCFLRLDDGLKRSLQMVKDGVGNVLRKVLGELSDEKGARFLEVLRERLPPEAKELREGLDMILGFDLSYRGLIQHRVRRHLDGLTPDLTTLRLSGRPDAEEVRDYLATLHKEALYLAEQALRGLLLEPNQAAFAMVEELVDRILRARGARTEWDVFLYDVRAEVWPDALGQVAARAEARRSWEEGVDSALSRADAPQLHALLR